MRWPVVRLFQRPRLGALLHALFVILVVGSSVALTAQGGALEQLRLPWLAGAIWAFWMSLAVTAWALGYYLATMQALIALRKRHKSGLLIWHLADMGYHLVRWPLFFGLAATKDVLAVALAYSLELAAVALLVAAAALYCLRMALCDGACCYCDCDSGDVELGVRKIEQRPRMSEAKIPARAADTGDATRYRGLLATALELGGLAWCERCDAIGALDDEAFWACGECSRRADRDDAARCCRCAAPYVCPSCEEYTCERCLAACLCGGRVCANCVLECARCLAPWCGSCDHACARQK